MGPVLLLHGFLGSSEDFSALKAELPAGASLTALDWPGHGTLSGLRAPSAYTLAAHLAPIGDWIRSQTKPGVLVGYSMGGRLLQHALASLPPLEPSWRVVLVSSSPGLADPDVAANRQAGDAAAARLLREQGIRPFLRYWHYQTMFRPMMALPEPVLAPILARRERSDPEGLALSLEAVGPGSVPSTEVLLRRLECRVDLVVGAEDKRYVDLAAEMAGMIRNARTHLVPGAGHAVHLECPGGLAAILSA